MKIEQLELGIIEPRIPKLWDEDPKGLRLYNAFTKFHRSNRHVYKILRDMALEDRQAGKKRGSIAQYYERARVQVETNETGSVKLNNDHRSGYSRMLMLNESELKGFFGTRASHAEALHKQGRNV